MGCAIKTGILWFARRFCLPIQALGPENAFASAEDRPLRRRNPIAIQSLIDGGSARPQGRLASPGRYLFQSVKSTVRLPLPRRAPTSRFDRTHFSHFEILTTDREKALARLEQAVEGREPLYWLKNRPLGQNLRSEPKFIELLKKVGLEK
jgi:hypothetical protein